MKLFFQIVIVGIIVVVGGGVITELLNLIGLIDFSLFYLAIQQINLITYDFSRLLDYPNVFMLLGYIWGRDLLVLAYNRLLRGY